MIDKLCYDHTSLGVDAYIRRSLVKELNQMSDD